MIIGDTKTADIGCVDPKSAGALQDSSREGEAHLRL